MREGQPQLDPHPKETRIPANEHPAHQLTCNLEAKSLSQQRTKLHKVTGISNDFLGREKINSDPLGTVDESCQHHFHLCNFLMSSRKDFRRR
ncbi:hypothetical protein Y1Q_0021728 [Alligator mississippiensis]|uniref:Uncharacterized protein n=1 Tax=Alligator mississippiensis TaxID=8496 RepID=A0A151PB25_ALLMI|nr:hypothetical protein Y1Q_0021728 [Alligator mississippiensis]